MTEKAFAARAFRDLAIIKKWAQRIPEPSENEPLVDVLRLAATNDAYRELCEKLAVILMSGSSELRTAIVTSLVLIQDASLSGTSIDFGSIAQIENESGAQ